MGAAYSSSELVEARIDRRIRESKHKDVLQDTFREWTIADAAYLKERLKDVIIKQKSENAGDESTQYSLASKEEVSENDLEGLGLGSGIHFSRL